MPQIAWNELLARLPQPHLLQTTEWAEVKRAGGWNSVYLVWDDQGCHAFSSTRAPEKIRAACLLLVKPLSRRLGKLSPSIAYCPKGPILHWEDGSLRHQVLADLVEQAKRKNAIFIKIDPDIHIGTGEPGTEFEVANPEYPAIARDVAKAGFVPSAEQIQFRNTVLIDVTAEPDELLARMKQKTRYNIRLAIKKGVTVRQGTISDADALYAMYVETATRDGFIIREKAYYQLVWRLFAQNSAPLIAEVDGEAVAAVYLFHFAGTAYYIYGMSRDAHREKMPNALLQYEAMLWARERGCGVYDMWGAPDTFEETDRMWGVYKFKLGFNGITRRTPGAYDAVLNPALYWLYTKAMPVILNAKRWLYHRGKRAG